MKRVSLFIAILVALAVIFILIGIANKSKDKQRSIAVVPMGTTHVFWQSIHRGAEKAGAEAGVKIFWNGPERERDRRSQIRASR